MLFISPVSLLHPHGILYLGLYFKEICFMSLLPSSLFAVFFLFLIFNIQRFCTQNRNGPQTRRIKAAVIEMTFLMSLCPVFSAPWQILPGPTLEGADSIMHVLGLCSHTFACPDGFTSHRFFFFLIPFLSSLEPLWGLFCSASPNANAVQDLE